MSTAISYSIALRLNTHNMNGKLVFALLVACVLGVSTNTWHFIISLIMLIVCS